MERPTGTITFLFTDIEGSTRRWEADADAMRVALVEHDEILRAAVADNDGWLFKHTGDGICAAFGSADQALAAATAAQRQLQLPVRMGLGTGTAEVRDGDYFGPVLNRAARVMAVAHGGQILLADSAASLVDPSNVRSLGEFRLRDLTGLHELFQAVADDLVQHFPPPRASRAAVGNLPTAQGELVGRAASVAELGELLDQRRLLTLIGVGGVGKSRLALSVAGSVAESFPGGAWWVELAPVSDNAAVAEAVAAVLGVSPRPDLSTAEAIGRTLADRPTLLILDNCEHVLDATAALVEAVLSCAPAARVLATSREGLAVAGEYLWVVPSLPSTDAESPAVQLFMDRTMAAGVEINRADAEEMAAVVEICSRLDGIALAIELAAARSATLSPQEICSRLDDRFRLLTGSRRRLERHQTLRQALQWSYDLLSAPEQSMLARCSIFAGGFDLESVTAICGGGGDDEFSVLELLQSLVGKSLMRSERIGGRSRFGLLETVRQYGAERLMTTGDLPDLQRRYVGWYADAVRTAWEQWNGPQQAQAVALLTSEAGNLRQAVEWALDAGDLTGAIAIAAHVAIAGWGAQWFEPAAWAAEILSRPGVQLEPQFPRLLSALGLIWCYTGRATEALELTRRAQQLSADDGFDPFIGLTDAFEATALVVLGDLQGWIDVCRRMAAGTGEARVIGLAGMMWGLPAVGRAEEARLLSAEANEAAASLGQPWWVAMASLGTGRAFALDTPEIARAALAEGIAVAGRHGMSMWEGMLARELAGVDATEGDVAGALARIDQALCASGAADDLVGVAMGMASLGVLLHALGRTESAAVAFGAVGLTSMLDAVIDATGASAAVDAALGREHAAELATRGATMTSRARLDWARDTIAELLAD